MDPKKRITIPRFCRLGEACPNKDTTCNYVHGDTIPCVDKPCGFDKPAEGKMCTGEKRKTCIFMHPSEGQVWNPDMVIHRPGALGGAGADPGFPVAAPKGDLIMIDGTRYITRNGNVYSNPLGAYVGRLAIDRSAAEVASGGSRSRRTRNRRSAKNKRSRRN